MRDKEAFFIWLLELFLNKPYLKKELILQDVAEVTYIPLETNERSFIKFFYISSLSVSDSFIVVVPKYHQGGNVFIFDREGKLRDSFDRSGRGPGEHGIIRNFFVDFKAEEIYIQEMYREIKFLIYDYEGNYKHTIRCLEDLSVESIHNYDDDYLLVYMYNKHLISLQNIRPYYLVSK